jgi:hypothetical protein
MPSPLTVKRNDYHARPKRSDVYTPPGVARFLFDILHHAERCDADRYVRTGGLRFERPAGFIDILDPAIGTGCLTDPWYGNVRGIVGCDIVDHKPRCDRFILGRFEDQTDVGPRPDLVLCNPPFNGAAGKQLYPEVFLRHAFKLFGETIPVVLFTPMGFRLNQRRKSARWRWLRDTQAKLSSIIALPLDTFPSVEFHAEILIFNVKGIHPHYFLPENAL